MNELVVSRAAGPSVPGYAQGSQAWVRAGAAWQLANWGDWGDEAAATATKPSDVMSMSVTQALPLVESIVGSLTDPYKQVEMLKIKIERAKSLGQYSRVQELQAQLKAAERRLAAKDEAQASLRELRDYGKGAIVTGYVVGGALTLMLLAFALRAARR